MAKLPVTFLGYMLISAGFANMLICSALSQDQDWNSDRLISIIRAREEQVHTVAATWRIIESIPDSRRTYYDRRYDSYALAAAASKIPCKAKESYESHGYMAYRKSSATLSS